MRLIFKSLNILRSTINAISMSSEVKEILDSAGNYLPNLFAFSTFGLLWREGPALHLLQEESCPPPFTQEVKGHLGKVWEMLEGKEIPSERVDLHVEKRKLGSRPLPMDPKASLRSYLTLPLAVEGEAIGIISLCSEQPNAFDAQDLQFFSVIGYQMAATLKHLQRFSSIQNMAIYDTLTNLYNRRYFEERLEAETQKAFYGKLSLSLVMIDIDHFKRINDTFGHTEGDKVIRSISDLLRASVRKKDTVARYGGEEFILILPGAGPNEAFMIAERIRRMVENNLFEVGQAQLNLTVSMGISNFPSNRAKTKEELVKMSDEALYEAKRSGRNRVCIHPLIPNREDKGP